MTEGGASVSEDLAPDPGDHRSGVIETAARLEELMRHTAPLSKDERLEIEDLSDAEWRSFLEALDD